MSTQPTTNTLSHEIDPNTDTETPLLHTVSQKSPFGALLSRTLPSYTGPYKVGVCDVEVPVSDKRTFGSFNHKKLFRNNDGKGGLVLSTVMFSLFYPCEKQAKVNPVVWFPRLGQTIDGFLKMAQRTPNFWYRLVSYPLAAAAISGTTFPASKDAPFLIPDEEGKKWPLMIFSHGAGCSRLMYSAFCGEMASRGYVVAVIEHRDGTSPSSIVTSGDGKTEEVDWVDWKDLEWPDLEEPPKDDTHLRHVQLDYRQAEVEAVWQIISSLSQGESFERHSIHAAEFDWNRWKHRVAFEKPIMAGHSLGGAVALKASGSGRIPFSHVVVFDPAVQRLEPWTTPLPHPLLTINSGEFVNTRPPSENDIFEKQFVPNVENERFHFFSIPGATHPSFSDVFLILPAYIARMTGLKADADVVISQTVHATHDFLCGKMDRVLRRAVRADTNASFKTLSGLSIGQSNGDSSNSSNESRINEQLDTGTVSRGCLGKKISKENSGHGLLVCHNP